MKRLSVLLLFVSLLCCPSIQPVLGYGLEVPFEYDFTEYPKKHLQLKDGSEIINGEKEGEKILVNNKGRSPFVFDLCLNGKFDTPVKMTVTAATGGEEQESATLGAVGLMIKNGRIVVPNVIMTIGWNKTLKRDVYTEQVFTINVPEKNRDKGEDLYVMLFRSNNKGLLKIKKIKLEYEPKKEVGTEIKQ